MQRRLKDISDYRVAVGVQGPEGKKRAPVRNGRRRRGGATVATVAAYSEFGTATEPARPFLRSTLATKRGEIITEATDAVALFLVRGIPATEALKIIGRHVAGLVRQRLDATRSWAAANAPSTVERKGFDWPLHDTGTLAKSISWTVRKAGRVIRRGSPTEGR